MDNPLCCWYCDECSEKIEGSEDGVVVWELPGNGVACNFRIIHTRTCKDHVVDSSLSLKHFLGPDGLTRLLSFLSAGPLIQGSIGEATRCRIHDLDAFVELIHRVQTPHYEEARRYFGDADVRESFSGANEVGPYTTDSLKGIITRYGS